MRLIKKHASQIMTSTEPLNLEKFNQRLQDQLSEMYSPYIQLVYTR
jgi:hypothetical protein